MSVVSVVSVVSVRFPRRKCVDEKNGRSNKRPITTGGQRMSLRGRVRIERFTLLHWRSLSQTHSVPFAQFLHPLGRIAWCATTLQCKTDHRPRSKWAFGEWHPLGRLLTVQPRQQPGSKPLIETGNALDGKINRAHGWKLDHPAPKSKGWSKRAASQLSAKEVSTHSN